MRLVAQPESEPEINTKPLDAYVASLSGWLSALLLWVIEVYEAVPPRLRDTPVIRAAARWAKAHVVADLRRSARNLRVLIMVQAMARMRFTACAPRPRHPPSTARGVRRARGLAFCARDFVGGAFADLHHGSLRQRVARMQRALAALPRLVARVLARMHVMWRTRPQGALIPVASRDLCCDVGRPIAPALRDSS